MHSHLPDLIHFLEGSMRMFLRAPQFQHLVSFNKYSCYTYSWEIFNSLTTLFIFNFAGADSPQSKVNTGRFVFPSIKTNSETKDQAKNLISDLGNLYLQSPEKGPAACNNQQVQRLKSVFHYLSWGILISCQNVDRAPYLFISFKDLNILAHCT